MDEPTWQEAREASDACCWCAVSASRYEDDRYTRLAREVSELAGRGLPMDVALEVLEAIRRLQVLLAREIGVAEEVRLAVEAERQRAARKNI